MNWTDLASLVVEHGAELHVESQGTQGWIGVFIRVPDADGGIAAGFAFDPLKTSEGEFKKLLQGMVDDVFFNL